MKQTAENRLIDFLRSNPSKFASANLQRLQWKNKNGTTASPRSIVRRLEENAVAGGVLDVSYDEHNNAYYQVKQEHIKRERRIEQIVLPDGTRAVREVYV